MFLNTTRNFELCLSFSDESLLIWKKKIREFYEIRHIFLQSLNLQTRDFPI